jgi:hypothetical protein
MYPELRGITMLKRLEREEQKMGVTAKFRDASFPTPFKEGLEYSSPARGTWNIVHTGMLIPESHQIFVCAQGCLRGVVLTAAEMNAMDRYSAIMIQEENVLLTIRILSFARCGRNFRILNLWTAT